MAEKGKDSSLGCKAWQSGFAVNQPICAAAYFDTENGCAGWSDAMGDGSTVDKVSEAAQTNCQSDWSTGCTNCTLAFAQCA